METNFKAVKTQYPLTTMVSALIYQLSSVNSKIYPASISLLFLNLRVGDTQFKHGPLSNLVWPLSVEWSVTSLIMMTSSPNMTSFSLSDVVWSSESVSGVFSSSGSIRVSIMSRVRNRSRRISTLSSSFSLWKRWKLRQSVEVKDGTPNSSFTEILGKSHTHH